MATPKRTAAQWALVYEEQKKHRESLIAQNPEMPIAQINAQVYARQYKYRASPVGQEKFNTWRKKPENQAKQREYSKRYEIRKRNQKYDDQFKRQTDYGWKPNRVPVKSTAADLLQ